MATRDHFLTAAERRRVLIVRIGAMGDVLHAMPAVAALRAMHPDWFIGWVIEPRWLPLLQTTGDHAGRSATMPLIDRTYLAPTRAWKKRPLAAETLGGIATLRRELRSSHFDLCVDMQGSIRSAVIGRMANAKVFAGPDHPRETPAQWLYGQKVQTSAAHVVEQGCEILGAAVGELIRPANAELPVDARAEATCNARLAQVPDTSSGLVLLAPGAGWGAKQWPAERYGEVATVLAGKGYRVLVNAYSMEDLLANEVARASRGSANIFPCDMAELIALTRQVDLVIAGDTGPLHLAAALERPVVALFGPTDPARNGPYATQSRVLRHGEQRRDHRRKDEPEAGLLAISVHEVIAAALELLKSTAKP